MGILEGALLAGVLLGSVCSSYVFKFVGYVGVYGICALVCFLGVLSTVALDESLSLDQVGF